MPRRSVLREMSGLDDDEFDRQRDDAVEFLQQSALLVNLVCMYDSEKAEMTVKAAESYDTIQSMFDPTGWMQNHQQAHANGKMVSILLNAKKKFTEMGLCPKEGK